MGNMCAFTYGPHKGLLLFDLGGNSPFAVIRARQVNQNELEKEIF